MERKQISKQLREKVYQKYEGRCAYCGLRLDIGKMQVDHLIPHEMCESYQATEPKKTEGLSPAEIHAWKVIYESLDENHPDNLMPACRQCNFYKGTKRLDKFRRDIEETLWGRVEKLFNYRLLMRYGMIKEYRQPVVFYFERKAENDD